MADERLRIPQDPKYINAIGTAVIAFARLEWNAVYCCERLENGYLETIETDKRKKPAGEIASDMKRLFDRISKYDLRSTVQPFAIEFKRLVDKRNALLHGKPGTTSAGEQRIFRGSEVWSIYDVHAFSDECVRADVPLNNLLHSDLAKGCAVSLDPN